MRNIIFPSLEETYFQIFKNIVDGKIQRNKELITPLYTEIEALFNTYEENKSNLFSLSAKGFTEEEVKALEDCYGDTKYTLVLKTMIRRLDGGACPYCNIDKSREVEHYLPASEFPEYAALIINLIPSCGSCNKKKLHGWRDDLSRLFLNAYFDEIPTHQFLFVKLSIEDGILIPEFYIDTTTEAIHPDVEVVLKKHVERLELEERYAQEIPDKITELKHRLEVSHALENDEIIKIINDEYNLQRKRYQDNYWLAVFYKALMDDSDCIEYLRNQSI